MKGSELSAGDPQNSWRTYPFAALAGQKDMRLALILAAVDPGLGGVLLRGEKGTAKSTAARGLARLLPDIAQMAGCAVGCDPWGPLCPDCQAREDEPEIIRSPTPFVDLPLGATEDRILGSLDLDMALSQGRVVFKPGLLARAHRGVLYIDEVNLLPGHLSQLILDAAASGVARIEREGLSHEHPASFILIASMNPEEGPLGPQLMDRFGLCVDVSGEPDPGTRLTILKRRLEFEADPAGFNARWTAQQELLRQKLAQARELLPRVLVPEPTLARAAYLAAEAESRGQRGELALIRAARALSAWRDEAEAGPELVEPVAHLALDHRRPETTENGDAPQARLQTAKTPEEASQAPKVVRVAPGEANLETGHRPGGERVLYIMPPGEVRPIATRLPAREGVSRKQPGRRRAREAVGDRGRYMRASARRLGRPIALDATLRAAAPHQAGRRRASSLSLVIAKWDLREKVRAARRGRLLLFCVDASGSMNAAARMRATKAAVLGLLTEAYQKRDRVGLVAFGGTGATELLPPTSSVEVARRRLAELPTGGKTPLAAGLVTLAGVLNREMAGDPRLTPLVVLLTDGRPNVPLDSGQAGRKAGNKGGGWGDGWGDGGYADREVLNLAQSLVRDPRPRFVVVDTDTGNPQEINLCQALAQYLRGPCFPLGRLSSEGVLDLVKRHW